MAGLTRTVHHEGVRRREIGGGIPSLAALVVALAGCGGADRSPRGFGSRQVLQSSDPTLRLHAFSEQVLPFTSMDGRQAYYSAPDLDVVWYKTGDGADTPVAYWALDLRDGAVQALGPTLPMVSIPPQDPPPGSLKCQYMSATGTLVISDPMRGTEATIDKIDFYSGCPTVEDPIIYVLRIGQGERDGLWAGPYDSLEPVPLEISIARLVAPDFSRGRADRRLIVVAAPDSAPDDLEIDEIALADMTVTTVVPARLAGGAWAPGAVGSDAALESDRLAPGDVRWLTGLGFFYRRQLRDGGVVMFVGPFAGEPASELALFPLAPGRDVLFGNMIGVAGAPTPAVAALTEYGPTPQEPNALHVWDAERRRFFSSPLPAGPAVLSSLPLGPQNAIVFAASVGGSDGSGPLALYLRDLEGPVSFRVLAGSGASQIAWSTEALVWRERVGAEDSDLRAVKYDGSQPRLIGTGWLQYPHFVSPFELQFFFSADLVGVDLRDDPVQLKYLAEAVFGSYLNWGTSVITGYEYNTQDGTGSLGVIQRKTLERRLISKAVDEFLLGSRPENAPVVAVYHVRGRNPSNQDGIWVATIGQDDLD